VNLLEVNVLEMEYKPFFRFIQDDHSIQATWRKYDSFLISSLMFGEIFCMDFVTINHVLDRDVFFPRRCEKHSCNARGKLGRYEDIGIL
jgi:hypothetical protein